VAEISVERLTKRYRETLAVDDLSFSVHGGRVTGFLGPNGAGKSTTLRALLGLVRPTSGQALVLDRPFAELRDPARTVGAALDAADLHPGRSGRSHLRTMSEAAGRPTSRVDEVLALVELTPARHRRVKGYSMGMRQRLVLAGALLGDPKILVLDEPANGLDPQGIRWLRDILRSLAAEGRTVLISSHVLSEVEQTVDEVVVISAGKLVTQGPLADIITAQRPAFVRTPQPEAFQAVLEADGAGVETDGRPEVLLVHRLALERIGTLAAEHGIVIFELTHSAASLEERFLELTGEGGNVR
jgi:ABC-2 type transport system ATP-binding protein